MVVVSVKQDNLDGSGKLVNLRRRHHRWQLGFSGCMLDFIGKAKSVGWWFRRPKNGDTGKNMRSLETPVKG